MLNHIMLCPAVSVLQGRSYPYGGHSGVKCPADWQNRQVLSSWCMNRSRTALDIEPLWRSVQMSLEAGLSVAVATVIGQNGSAPQPEGASLMVRADGSIVGAVSTGCLESDVVSRCLRVLETGQPEVHAYQKASNDDPLALGLSCGGHVELAIERWSPEELPLLKLLFDALQRDEEVLVATTYEPEWTIGIRTRSQYEGNLPHQIWNQLMNYNLADSAQRASRMWPARAWLTNSKNGESTVWRSHQPATPLWIFGATEIANTLAALARPMGFKSSIIDARAHFATVERCSAADEVICSWPHRWLEQQLVSASTVICALNHDPKFEIPLLVQALRSEATYVGAMGSRSTHRQRIRSLSAAGLSMDEIKRLRAPIGIDLGGKSAAEIALSILSEIVMLRNGSDGAPLTGGQGSIHRR